ncbi:HNH endonuclease [Priestia aryabhattai]|uniref:HNH endonuclease n=1 Tax=Priestia TaxID=2800373 RepID=UPI003F8B54CC
MKCYVCCTDLTQENETEEHILLNAIGGKLKSRRLICRDCNSKFGGKIDDKLAQQLNPISTLLNVKRDRGKPQNIIGKYEHKEIIIEPGGKIKLARPYIDDKDEEVIRVEASTLNELTKILKSLRRKYPNLDVDKTIKNAKKSHDYLPSLSLNMNFGGKEIRQAICKMAVNFYILNGGDPKVIEHLLPFIEGNVEEAEVYYFYPRSEVFYKDEKDIMHTLILVGNNQKKELYVYVELFNEFKFVIIIDREYNGQSIYHSYHYNVVTNNEIKYDTPVKITPKELKKYISKDIDKSQFKKRIQFLFQRIDNVNSSKKISDITDKAMEETIKKYPPEQNPVFTKEMTSYLADRVVREYFLAFQHRYM